MIESDTFIKKISILYETPSLWSEEDLNITKDKLDKLSKMPNINYYIRSDDFEKIINDKDEKFYLRLMIDSPDNYIKNELMKSEDYMCISDSPGRNKFLSSKSSENIRKKKSRKSRRSIKNNDDDIIYYKKGILIKSKMNLVYYIKDNEKYSSFMCHIKDDVMYCTSINDDHIKGPEFSKLLTYESVDINIGNKMIMVHSLDIKILTFPIYFILQNHELIIDDFICIIECILESI
jgi:hypothetical protein